MPCGDCGIYLSKQLIKKKGQLRPRGGAGLLRLKRAGYPPICLTILSIATAVAATASAVMPAISWLV